jgi:tripartite-type tricarboxylate transporter receptor subunit TctC
MTDPAVVEKIELTGGYPMTMSPEAFSAFMRREADRWQPVLKEVGLRY